MGLAYNVGITMAYKNSADFYYDLNVAQKKGLTEGEVVSTALSEERQKRIDAAMETENVETIGRRVKIYEKHLSLRSMPSSNCGDVRLGFGLGSGESSVSGGLTGSRTSYENQEVDKKLPSAANFMVPIDRLVHSLDTRLNPALDIRFPNLWPRVRITHRTHRAICFRKV